MDVRRSGILRPPAWSSDRLDALLTDPVQRSYLASDGWWADEILREFSFLADHGIELDQVTFHFKEHSLICRGPRHDLFFVYAPDGSESFLLAWMAWKPKEDTAGLDEVIRHYEPTLVPPVAIPGDMESMTRRIRYWGKGMRLVADRVFADANPALADRPPARLERPR